MVPLQEFTHELEEERNVDLLHAFDSKLEQLADNGFHSWDQVLVADDGVQSVQTLVCECLLAAVH